VTDLELNIVRNAIENVLRNVPGIMEIGKVALTESAMVDIKSRLAALESHAMWPPSQPNFSSPSIGNLRAK
jgi:hypothetical protein